MRNSLILATSLLAACGSADMAPQAQSPDVALTAPDAANSPYQVELVTAGQGLPTYEHNGRFYVLGQVGQRYSIRVKNPTPVRVEAVISVDGIDVIDGETANSNKRGYVVMPRSSITIDGFRVSTQQVAAFRFSSVDDSYAGRKGKARNVGAIGVAIFSEDAPPELIMPKQDRRYRGDRFEDEDDYDMGASADDRVAPTGARAPSNGLKAKRRPPPSKPSSTSVGEAQIDSGLEIAPRERPRDEPCCGPRTDRPGLGTEYGERRYSAVDFTRFVRASSEPTAYAELRYNNAAGLSALGITTGPGFDDREITRRETAEPFPGQRFSQPPQ